MPFRRALISMSFVAAALAWGGAWSEERDAAEIVFSAAEKAIIADYYGRKGGAEADGPAGEKSQGKKGNKGNKGKQEGGQSMPPGLAGKERLPPGLARKEQLPPGLAKRQLPSALNGLLPPVPAGLERAIVDDNVVLIDIATQVVHDVISHVVTE